MKDDQFLTYIIEADLGEPNVQAYFDRLMMRLFESPPLLASFVNAATFEDGDDVVIQLEFHQVPREFHQDLAKIAGARDVQVVVYEKDSTTYTGMQVRLKNNDLAPKMNVEPEHGVMPLQLTGGSNNLGGAQGRVV